MSNTNTTAPVSDSPDRPTDDLTEEWGLVWIWSASQPERVGEIGFISNGERVVLGRVKTDDDPLLEWFQVRPGERIATGPIIDDGISRAQLRLTGQSFGLVAEPLGKCPMFLNRKRMTGTEFLKPGDILGFHTQLSLMVVKRTRAMLELERFSPGWWGKFGQPNALGMVGESPVMWALWERLAIAALSGGHVFLHGESGSGKEFAARGIHLLGPRAKGPFVAHNAALITSTLASVEIAGSAKNFPNAGQPERVGLIGASEGGVLFLDEIGRLCPEDQAMLLRAMDGDYKRLGEAFARPCSLVLVVATNEPAALRRDFVRRFMFDIVIPTLDARREDIPLLVRFLIQRQFDKGNVLARDPNAPEGVIRPRPVPQLVIEELLAMSFKDGNIGLLDKALWAALTGAAKAQAEADTTLGVEIVKEMLIKCKGNVAEAARQLGRTREELVWFIKKFDLHEFVASTRTPK